MKLSLQAHIKKADNSIEEQIADFFRQDGRFVVFSYPYGYTVRIKGSAAISPLLDLLVYVENHILCPIPKLQKVENNFLLSELNNNMIELGREIMGGDLQKLPELADLACGWVEVAEGVGK